MKKINLIAILVFTNAFSQVGIKTINPSEMLDVNGIERIRELPRHQMNNSIFTKPDGSRSNNQDQTFIATRTLVADANGVLGYIDGLPGGIVPSTSKRKTIGYWAGLWDGNYYALGGTGFPIFNLQLQNKLNYGVNGIYNKIDGIDFLQFETPQINSYTGAQLKSIVDIFCIGLDPFVDLDATTITKIKDFTDLGGVVIVLLDANRNTPAHQGFGGAGSVTSGTGVSYSLAGTIGSNGVFGTVAGNTPITGMQTAGRILNSQLPAGATILAREGGITTTQAGIWTTGANERVIFFWDEGVFRNPNIAGTYINTDQEKYLHNIMAYALDKVN
ncbi:hypothetical protein C1631_012220 [Chryseobacterium phosphatilyticum]|uniref:Uncharacterized protein n=1 Tax=Chryseobacterium phosphatilyticum TaxID=475075 RepID=A0A316X4Y3_9FLAO|nr:hypothetical protein [Chryseobacterium phosphatilyticum]PWN68845.1 hypothetical protein C1631_012220 [Chryseobacterium phosphatilyticum]